MVYKVVEFKGIPRIKLSEEPGKTLIPGTKEVLRAFDAEGKPIFDLLCLRNELEYFIDGSGMKDTFYDY